MSPSAQTDTEDDLAPWQPCDASLWQRMQAKRAFKIVLGKMLQPAARKPDDEEVPYLKALHVQWGRVELDNLPTMWAAPWEVAQLNLAIGDLLVCEGGEVGRAARLTVQPPEKCIIQNALHRVRGRELGDVGFLGYCLRHASDKGWFDVLCNRATIAHFTVEKFRDLWLRLPPVEMQRRIVEYLDAETAQIDALVVEKEKMLALLEEKRAALVSRAVTRGIDPNAPMKPSGLDWLGDIPAHWEVKRAKQLFAVRDERSETGDEELLTVSHITGVTPRSEKEVFMFKAEDMTGYKLCYPGDLVVNTLWAWMGAMGIVSQHGIVSPDYHVYTSTGKLKPAYVEALCRSKPFVTEVLRHSKGVWSSRLRLYPEAFFEIRLPVPPSDEQDAIIDELSQERARTAELEASLNRTISLLKERRSALITAAVTGQLELEAMTA